MSIIFVVILLLLVFYVFGNDFDRRNQKCAKKPCGNVLYDGENPGYYPGPYISSMPMWYETPY